MDIQSDQNLILDFAEEYLSQAKSYSNEDYKLIRQKLEQLNTQMEVAGYNDQTIENTHYLICAFIDDVATWNHSLLSHFYNVDPDSKENDFFERIESLQKSPEENIECLELAYLCLSLNYQGKYKHSDNKDELTDLTDALFDDIRDVRPEPTAEFSKNKAAEEYYWRLPPIWLTIIFTIIILFAIYLPYNNKLNEYAKPVLHSLQSMIQKDGSTNES